MVSYWSALFDALQHPSGLAAFALGSAFTSIAYARKRLSAFLSAFFRGINKFSLEAEHLSVQWDRTKHKVPPKRIDPKH
jgi:hypothetical protein